MELLYFLQTSGLELEVQEQYGCLHERFGPSFPGGRTKGVSFMHKILNFSVLDDESIQSTLDFEVLVERLDFHATKYLLISSMTLHLAP